jgi:hypothetical protein
MAVDVALLKDNDDDFSKFDDDGDASGITIK